MKQRTLRSCVQGASDAARTAWALGFRHELGDKAGGRGQAPLLLRIATAEKLESEEGDALFDEPEQGELAEEEG